jgi:Carboxypeptidase regulatory-like domain/TonB-dependent Receptor Plug Domain
MNCSSTRVLSAFVFLAVVSLFSPPVLAQGGGATTSLSGSVTDTSGAVIPGANVVVKNTGTAAQYEAVTNESGYFTVPALNPGTYSVTVTLMGFKTAVVNDVKVNASTPTSVKVALEVGGLEETVQVTGGSEIIQTTTPAVTSTIDANQILKLPTGSRDALQFVALLPGVNTPGGPGENRDSTVNGLPQSTINITIDGMSAQDNYLKTTDGFFARVNPRLDAVEEVTVSMAAQNAASTGQGAVQIRFVTRSGSNQFSGSGYYYLRHYKLNANDWFNNRDLPPGPNGKAPKNEDVLYQPGVRAGGPIVIPGLWSGRDKAFFFFNYEESRSPGSNTENRTVLHPRAEQGFFRYTASGQTVERNVLTILGNAGFVSTIDPTIGRLLGDIRAAVSGAGTGLVDNTDPLTQQFTYQYNTEGITRYPTGRVDVNVTNKHRVSWSMNYTDLVSTPDTTNNREPNFPGFPGTGSQISDRYTVQGTLRSALTSNLVNEFRIGGTGGATFFSPEISPAQYGGTAVADQGGFQLNINSVSVAGITNAHSTTAYQAREASTKVIDNTLNWLRGSHSIQMGGSFTRGDLWIERQTWVPTINFQVVSTDPADAVFNTTNFPGASNVQLTEARDLYAMLTGRISSINAEQRLDASDQYEFLGRSRELARLLDFGFFVADTWRWRPDFTINLGLRYELQSPFYPLNNSYSRATIEDVWGVSGVGNLFKPGTLTGRPPVFEQYNKGDDAYNWDKNNFAPSVGFAWTVGGNAGFLNHILGKESGDSVLRAGYSLAYNRPGMNDFAGTIDDNPGIQIGANRNHTLGNLGTPGSILFRNRGDLGPPANMPTTRTYPMTDAITEDVATFDPDVQVPYAQTWTAGWQRKLTGDMVVEARYVGTRSLQPWRTFSYNEINIVENGFLDEFRRAQQNLEANIAAQRGANFRYAGPGTGTVPLPIFVAYFAGKVDPSLISSYNSALFANSTFVNPLAKFNPQPQIMATALDADSARINNALAAGLPANFLVANPHLLGGAEVNGNGGFTNYNSLQLELRKRLSRGLQFQASYVYGNAYLANFYSFRRPWVSTLDTGTEGGVKHTARANWVYELPFGRGRRWGGGVGNWMDRLIGGWSLDGIARIQSGTQLDFGNVRLVGMTADELRKAFKLRFDDAGKLVYMLPQDIIDNTVRAWDVSATRQTGYGDRGAPTGRYIAPANGPDCIELAQTFPATGYGDCGVRELVVTGPTLVRFDLSAAKRVPIAGRVNFEFRAEMLNAFNTPWFEAVTGLDNEDEATETYANPDEFRVTDAQSGRIIQFVFRVNW